MEIRSLTTADGAEISYRVRRGRDPLVLLHALGCDARMWDDVVTRLDADQGLVIPELRGHGASTLGFRVPSVATWAGDVHTVVEHERLVRPAIAGISMGGYTALAFAAAQPGKARAYGLISTSAAPDDEAGRLRRAAGVAQIQLEGWKAFAEALMPKLITLDRPGAEARRDLLLEMFERAGSAGLAAAVQALANREDSRPLLSKLGVPVRVLVGDVDVLTPPERAREIASAVPGATLRVLEGVNHLSALEAPQEISEMLARL
jgi:pimeloyl-ACP methyl ester carboxylesterase